MDNRRFAGATVTPPAPDPNDRPRVSVVIPAKNEARNIGWVLRRLPLSVDEVVLVDGASTDGTVDVARAIRPDVVVVPDREPGKGCALRAGVEAATGDYVVMLDADGSMDPGDIDRFVAALDAGADLAKGSRFMPDGGSADITPLRDLGNKGLLLVSNLLFWRHHTDLCYGYAAFRRAAFQELGLTAQGFEIEAQLFLRATRHGLRVTEVASFEAPRRYGNSKLNTFRDGWRVLRTILDERLRPAGSRSALGLDLAPVALIAEPGFGGAPPSEEVGALAADSMSSASVAEPVPRPRRRRPAGEPDRPSDRSGRALDDDRFRSLRRTLGGMPVSRNVPD